MSFGFRKQCIGGFAFAAGVVGAVSVSPAFAAASEAEAMMQDNWRETMARTATPHEGCFEAEFPNAVWVEASCVVAPDKVYVPHRKAGPQTVGDGADYAASVSGLMSAAVGSFPTVSGDRKSVV